MQPSSTADDSNRVLLAATNLRDQGGYQTADGQTVRTGLLYRGGHMANLDDRQHDTYQTLNLTTIVDLRRQDEIDQRPTPTFGNEVNLHCSVSDGESALSQMAGFLDEPDAAPRIVAAGAGYYERIVSHNLSRFTPAFRALLDPARLPALFTALRAKIAPVSPGPRS